jgi:hypothetical protein
MLRYDLHAICSGMVDRVYWWRLVAAPFGLVDDSGPEWRARPAYRALQTFLREFGEATFTGLLPAPDGACLMRFRRRGDEAVIGFRAAGPTRVDLPFAYETALLATGEEAGGRGGPADAGAAELGGRPLFFLQARF